MSTGLAVRCQNSKEDHGEHTPGPISGVWDMGHRGPWHLVVLLCTLPHHLLPGQVMQFHCSQAWATRGSQRQASLATTTTTALPHLPEPRQPSPTHPPNFTWKYSHVPMDATALQSIHKSSMQPMAGVAGCFVINSRENGSSCDSQRVLSIEPGAALVFSVE